MTITSKTFDPKCFDLAEEFLSDTDTFRIHSEARCNELAVLIQQTIEDFIADALAALCPAESTQMTSTEITEAALTLLKEMEFVPQVVGYDHRIAELDNARLIEWEPRWGYKPSPSGFALLASKAPA